VHYTYLKLFGKSFQTFTRANIFPLSVGDLLTFSSSSSLKFNRSRPRLSGVVYRTYIKLLVCRRKSSPAPPLGVAMTAFSDHFAIQFHEVLSQLPQALGRSVVHLGKASGKSLQAPTHPNNF
jgi:hypothetical protein